LTALLRQLEAGRRLTTNKLPAKRRLREMIAEGEIAPDFELQTDSGESVRLSDYRGKPVVLYFYPKDNTPGCTKEACGIRDA